jgi:hypothetical protein
MRCHESIFRILCLLVVLLGVQGTENELAERALPSPDPCQRHRSDADLLIDFCQNGDIRLIAQIISASKAISFCSSFLSYPIVKTVTAPKTALATATSSLTQFLTVQVYSELIRID